MFVHQLRANFVIHLIYQQAIVWLPTIVRSAKEEIYIACIGRHLCVDLVCLCDGYMAVEFLDIYFIRY